jgi:hypothetical protein
LHATPNRRSLLPAFLRRRINFMRNGTGSSSRPLRRSGGTALAKIATLADDLLSLGESYEELLRLRERVAALSRRKGKNKKKTKPAAAKRLRPKAGRSPKRPRR